MVYTGRNKSLLLATTVMHIVNKESTPRNRSRKQVKHIKKSEQQCEQFVLGSSSIQPNRKSLYASWGAGGLSQAVVTEEATGQRWIFCEWLWNRSSSCGHGEAIQCSITRSCHFWNTGEIYLYSPVFKSWQEIQIVVKPLNGRKPPHQSLGFLPLFLDKGS